MADIFISYKKEDAGRVVRIVEGLRAEGLSVWWDHGIAPGSQWDETIQTELKLAKAVVAVWSENSVSAPWVKEEAAVGKNRGILLPVLIDDVEPPLGFGLIQAADLRGWDGQAKDPHFQHFLGALRAILSGERVAGMDAPRRRKSLPWMLLALAAVLLGGAVAGGLLLGNRAPVEVATQDPAALPVPGATPGAVSPSAPAGVVPGATPSPAPAAASPEDDRLFAAAQAARTKQAFQDYLISYPNGAHADRVRNILLACRSEQREAWEPGGTGQPARGLSTESDLTRDQACAAASTMANRQAALNCRTLTGSGQFRNGRVSVQPATCDCTQASYGWSCTIDLPARCDWEQRMPQVVEVCG
jgi:hypothetical protein